MSILTRSKAELGQPRQGNGVLAEFEEVGRYVLNYFSANGNQSTLGFETFKCKSERCLACLKLIINNTSKSSVSQKIIR